VPTPKRDKVALVTLATHLRSAPRAIEQIQQLMNISEASAHRWLRYLQQMGYDVVRRRNPLTKTLYYSILGGKQPKG
jgi:predicted transcriptional regulator